MAAIFQREEKQEAETEDGAKEYNEALAHFIQNLNSMRLSTGNSVWLCWRGGIVRRVDYDGNLSPIYAASKLPYSTLKEPLKFTLTIHI